MGMIIVSIVTALLCAPASVNLASMEPEVATNCARGGDCSSSRYVVQLENLFSEIISRAEIGRLKTTLLHECSGADTSHTTMQTLSAQIMNLTEQITDVVNRREVCEELVLDLRSTVTSELAQFQQLIKNISSTTEQEIRRLDLSLSALQKNTTVEDQIANCPPGFSTLPGFSASCYRFVTSAMTWDDADQFCRRSARGAHLAVVDSPEEDQAIIDHLKSIQLIYGAHISGQTLDPKNCSSPYHWKPFPGIHIPVNYTNWDDGEPNCVNNYQTCLQYLYFKWDDVQCHAEKGFVCEFDRSNELLMLFINAMNRDADLNRQDAEKVTKAKDKFDPLQNDAIQSKQENAVVAAKLSMPACPQDFFRLPGYMGTSCYRVIYEQANWEEAGVKCRSLGNGTHLAVVEDETENLAVVQYLLSIKGALNRKCRPRGSLWTSGQLLNCTDCTSGYVWKPYPSITIPMNFTSWAPNEPNCGDGWDSVQYRGNNSFKWDNLHNTSTVCPLCEYDNIDD